MRPTCSPGSPPRLGLTPPGGRLVVLSDGGQTQGDARGRGRDGRPPRSVDRLGAARRSRPPRRRDHRDPRARRGPRRRHRPADAHGPQHRRRPRPCSAISRDGGHPASQAIRLRAGDNPLLLLYTATRRGWNSFSATIADARRRRPRRRCRLGGRPRRRAAAGAGRRRARLARRGAVGAPAAAGHDRRTREAARRPPPRTAATTRSCSTTSRPRRCSAAQIAALVAAVRLDGLGTVALGGPAQLLAGTLREVTAAADPPGLEPACRATCGGATSRSSWCSTTRGA